MTQEQPSPTQLPEPTFSLLPLPSVLPSAPGESAHNPAQAPLSPSSALQPWSPPRSAFWEENDVTPGLRDQCQSRSQGPSQKGQCACAIDPLSLIFFFFRKRAKTEGRAVRMRPPGCTLRAARAEASLKLVGPLQSYLVNSLVTERLGSSCLQRGRLLRRLSGCQPDKSFPGTKFPRISIGFAC